jgi:hypothetical protein
MPQTNRKKSRSNFMDFAGFSIGRILDLKNVHQRLFFKPVLIKLSVSGSAWCD